MSVYACVRARERVRACVRVSVHAGVRVCVCVCVCVDKPKSDWKPFKTDMFVFLCVQVYIHMHCVSKMWCAKYLDVSMYHAEYLYECMYVWSENGWSCLKANITKKKKCTQRCNMYVYI